MPPFLYFICLHEIFFVILRKINDMRKLTNEEYIQKAREIHGDKYDYSKTIYLSSREPIVVICPIHGEFQQLPKSHLIGSGCPQCGNKLKSQQKKLTQEIFVTRCNEVHNNKYDYSKVIYTNKRDKVTIICPIHGEFEQEAGHHMRGQGCPECGKASAQKRDGNYKNSRKTVESFKDDIHIIFGGKYEVVGEYVNNKTKIELYCKEKYKDGTEHGSFLCRPDGLIQGHGCPKCSVNKSYAEQEIAKFIRQHYTGEIIHSYRGFDGQKEIDIYLPDLKLGFEYNGLLWHSTKYTNKTNMCDKLNIAEAIGIRLINIFEDEWLEKQEICKSRILNLIGKSKKIHARKCHIKEITYQETQKFLSENHIQGPVVSKYNLALLFNEEIVSVMTFGSLRKNLGSSHKEGYFELLRFCNKLNTTVIGGASRLFAYFIKTYKPIEILSYADRRWSQGNLYENLGFTFIDNTKPNYFYIDGKKQVRINRFNFRKNVLVEKYNCPQDVSEVEFCNSIGFYQVFDCGNKKYIWRKEN